MSIVGKIVTVIVDRPLGSRHPTHKNIRYPVNYVYIPTVMANDDEEQDAYILGVNIPLKEFTGKVIAIVHRKNDMEDKWIVVPQNVFLSKREILEKIHFQEQYFDIEIET